MLGQYSSYFTRLFQTCISANRFLIHEKRYDEFISKFSEKIKLLVVGDGAVSGVNVGPLINKAQLTKVSNFIIGGIRIHLLFRDLKLPGIRCLIAPAIWYLPKNLLFISYWRHSKLFSMICNYLLSGGKLPVPT